MRKLSIFLMTAFCAAANYFGFGGCSSTPATLHTLSLAVTGTGTGKVSSDVGDLDCRESSGVCSAEIEEGTQVTLTATPDAGFAFLGWYEGSCTGGSTCTVTLDAAKTAKAAFVPIVFVSTRSLDGSETPIPGGPVQNIFTVKTDGTDLKAITNIGAGNPFNGIAGPRWSPDGEKILFQSRGVTALNDGPTSNVWVAAGDGSSLESLTKSTFGGQNVTPNWSPNGDRIVFCSDRKLDGTDAANDNSITNVWIMNADGSDPHPLTEMTAVDAYNCFPSFSPDGTKILFNASRDLDGSNASALPDTYNIWSISPDGSDLKAITKSTAVNADNDLGDISDDGTKIVYRSDRHLDGSDQLGPNESSNVWIADIDGDNAHPVTNFTVANASAGRGTFSHDGKTIFYSSNGRLDGTDALGPNGAINIWSASPDGADRTPLTTLTAADIINFQPDVRIDDQKILFTSTRDVSGDDVPGMTATTNLWIMDADGGNQQPVTSASTAGSTQADGLWSR